MQDNDDMLGMHEDYLAREYNYSISYTMEIPTKLAKDVLPKGLYPSEIRPQVSLLTIGILNFDEPENGHPLTEVSLAINVMPDISLAGEMPRFALYILNTGSTIASPELSAVSEAFKLPLHPEALKIDLNTEKGTVKCFDSLGKTVFELNDLSAEIEAREYDYKDNFFQVFSQHEGNLFHSTITVSVDMYEHQKKGQVGKLYQHDFFKNLNVSDISTDNYLQIVTPYETVGMQLYFRPADVAQSV